jgi:hypothetical protein
MVKDMNKALRDAALLRNLMETCLKASAAPMTGRELADWPSIAEHIGTGLSGYGKLSNQLSNMVAKGLVDKIGQGPITTYAWSNKQPTLKLQAVVLPELHLRLNRKAHSISFKFEGWLFTIDVAE